MNKAGLAIVAVISVVLIAGGTWYVLSQTDDSSSENPATVDTSAGNNAQPGDTASGGDQAVNEAAARLASNGMTVEPGQDADFNAVNAQSGIKVTVNGAAVDIYSYGSTASQAEGVDALRQANEAPAEIFEHENLVFVIHSSDQALIDQIKSIMTS